MLDKFWQSKTYSLHNNMVHLLLIHIVLYPQLLRMEMKLIQIKVLETFVLQMPCCSTGVWDIEKRNICVKCENKVNVSLVEYEIGSINNGVGHSSELDLRKMSKLFVKIIPGNLKSNIYIVLTKKMTMLKVWQHLYCTVDTRIPMYPTSLLTTKLESRLTMMVIMKHT